MTQQLFSQSTFELQIKLLNCFDYVSWNNEWGRKTCSIFFFSINNVFFEALKSVLTSKHRHFVAQAKNHKKIIFKLFHCFLFFPLEIQYPRSCYTVHYDHIPQTTPPVTEHLLVIQYSNKVNLLRLWHWRDVTLKDSNGPQHILWLFFWILTSV